jgi:hypothetical protein
MTESFSAAPLPRPLKQRINQLAHAAGAKHGAAVRDRLTAELQAMRKAGRTVGDLELHLETLERIK